MHDDDNFWAAPEFRSTPERPLYPGETPGVWTWFVVYCVFMALLYLMFAGLGVLYLVIPEEIVDNPDEAVIMRVVGGVFLVLGLGLTALFGSAPFLPKRPWVWIYDIVLICLGLTSCCTLPFCIPLLIYWLKPEVRVFFGRS